MIFNRNAKLFLLGRPNAIRRKGTEDHAVRLFVFDLRSRQRARRRAAPSDDVQTMRHIRDGEAGPVLYRERSKRTDRRLTESGDKADKRSCRGSVPS